MSYLSNTQTLNYAPDLANFTYNPLAESTRPHIRFAEINVEKTVEMDDSGDFKSGDWGGSMVATAGAKLATITAPFKLSSGEFVTATNEHKLPYIDLFESCGLGYKGIDVAVTDTAPNGLHIFYPTDTKACKTKSFASYLKEACGSAPTSELSKVYGVMANFNIDASGRGSPIMFNYEGQGVVEDVDNVATSAVPLFDDAKALQIVPSKFLDTTITLTPVDGGNASTVCVTTMNFNNNAVISEVECQETESGLAGYIITDIDPKLTLDPLHKTKADFDSWGALNSEKVYSVTVDNPDFMIYIPRAQMLTATTADANGYMRDSIEWKILRNTDSDIPTGTVVGDWTGVNLPASMYFIIIKEKVANM